MPRNGDDTFTQAGAFFKAGRSEICSGEANKISVIECNCTDNELNNLGLCSQHESRLPTKTVLVTSRTHVLYGDGKWFAIASDGNFLATDRVIIGVRNGAQKLIPKIFTKGDGQSRVVYWNTAGAELIVGTMRVE